MSEDFQHCGWNTSGVKSRRPLGGTSYLTRDAWLSGLQPGHAFSRPNVDRLFPITSLGSLGLTTMTAIKKRLRVPGGKCSDDWSRSPAPLDPHRAQQLRATSLSERGAAKRLMRNELLERGTMDRRGYWRYLTIRRDASRQRHISRASRLDA